MIIDVYDDLGESYLASLGASNPPELLKEASWREADELLDRDYALIIHDEEGREHRKFASHDSGNIAMSGWYLQHVSHEVLPDFAIKIATYNLKIAAGEEATYPELTDEEKQHVIDERRVHLDLREHPEVETLDWDEAKTAAYDKGRGKSAYDFLKHAQEHWADFDPYERREAARILIPLEKTAALIVPEHIYKYGGSDLNPLFGNIIKHRLEHVGDEELQAGYMRLSKTASAMDLGDVVNILFTLDESASLTPRYGNGLPDPVLSVYGQVKEAEWSWVHGGYMVNERQLIDYANAPMLGSVKMTDIFTPDIVQKFRKDPIGTFKKMPIEQQGILARLATQGKYHNDGGS